jgi:thiol:disulfide interchange protein DsbD
MKHNYWTPLVFFLLVTTFSQAASLASDQASPELNIKLGYMPQEEGLLGAELLIEPGWHIYWKNSGDSGSPTEFKWETSAQEKIEELEWEAPSIHKEGEALWTHGYEKSALFFFNTQNLKQSTSLVLTLNYLICKDLCFPGKKMLSLDIKDGKIIIPSDLEADQERTNWSSRYELLPKLEQQSSRAEIYLETSSKKIAMLIYTKEYGQKDFLTLPYLVKPFSFGHEEIKIDSTYPKEFVSYRELTWDGMYQTPEMVLPEDGVFKEEFQFQYLLQTYNKTIIQNFKTNTLTLLTEAQWKEKFSTFTTYTPPKIEKKETAPFQWSLILFAFLGGLLLNLMPCVFPVMSLKLYSLSQSTKMAYKHALAYALGVILSLEILALIILMIKASGHELGWGFQLQSPLFVFLLTTLFLIMTLNLFGVFEFSTPFGSKIHSVQSKHPYINDLLSGILATLVATPCSAPFVGAALTAALTTSSLGCLSLFFVMGVGLSLPVVLLTLIPAWKKILPRPGAWMNTFKLIMAFCMLLSTLWLLDVYLTLTSKNNFWPLVWFSVLAISLCMRKTLYGSKVLLGLMATILIYSSLEINPWTKNIDKLSWESWSPEAPQKIEEWQNKRQAFFLDFTAKWCITCQVNKKLVLETLEFQEFAQKNNLKLMRIDWTKQDPEILAWMTAHDSVSVPAYYLSSADGTLQNLGSTLSLSKLQKAYEKK